MAKIDGASIGLVNERIAEDKKVHKLADDVKDIIFRRIKVDDLDVSF